MNSQYSFNPDIFIWARESAGFTREEAVRLLPLRDAYGKTSLERLIEIETGIACPSNAVVRSMAKRYNRPEIVFYLKNAPKDPKHGVDYRTLEAQTSKIEQGLANAVVRDIVARQDVVKATLVDYNEVEEKTFVGSATTRDSKFKLAKSICQTLDFSLVDYRKPSRPQSAFNYLRGLVERLGVFVVLVDNLGGQSTKISPKVFRGFSIADEYVPFIAINCNDTGSAWSLTLLHQLTHIWIGSTGISNHNTSHNVEKLCDEVASEILVPKSEFASAPWENFETLDQQMAEISHYASKINVSVTTIAFRLFKEGVISEQRFSSISRIIANTVSKSKADRDKSIRGPSYYSIRAHRSGKPLIEFTDRMLADRQISIHSAGLLLGVRPTDVYRMLQKNRYD